MATRRRTRRKNASQPQKAKAKKAKSPQAQVQALQQKLAKMQINTSPFSHVGGTVGGKIGGFFGNPTLGSGIGSWLGQGIGKIFGSGAYKLSKNSLWSTSDQCPVMHSTSESIILRHREYICDVNSSVGFVTTEFPINPGLVQTFPFLSTIAANFQEYNFRGLVFEFKSTSADALNSTNTALGTVAMAVQYRANATSFTTKQQLLNEMWSADAKPATSFFMPVECAPAECPMDIQYVRTGALSSADDIKFYDLGKLSLATVGSQAASVVGELWASYEIALRKPILGGSIGVDANSMSVFRTGVGATTAALGTDTAYGSNSIGAVFSASNTISFPVGLSGKYVFNVGWYGATGTWAAPTITSYSNISFITQNGNQWIAGGTGLTASSAFLTTWFYVTDPSKGASISVGSQTFVTPVYAYVTVGQLDFDTVPT